MKDILALASNDNLVTSINFKDNLEINIETWDGNDNYIKSIKNIYLNK